MGRKPKASGRGAGDASEFGAGEAHCGDEDESEENEDEGETESARRAPAGPVASALGVAAGERDKAEDEAGIAESRGAGAKASSDQTREPGRESSASSCDKENECRGPGAGVASREASATPAERIERPKSMA